MNLFSGENKDVRKKINAGSSSLLVKFLRKMIDSFPFNTIFGEGGLLYILNGTLRGIKLIKKNKISHIYTSFRPLADHIIAYNLRLFFPELKWIADFRDLPVDRFRSNTFIPSLQKAFLKKLISGAHQIITVSNGLNINLKKIRPDSKLIRNGIFNIYNVSKSKANDRFTISYTGSLYPDFRKPTIFLKVLSNLLKNNIISDSEIVVQYAGKDNEIWNRWIDEFELRSVSKDLGELSLFDSIKMQTDSDLLLLITWSDNQNKGILTGKLFEYLASGNTVFALINGDKDEEMEEILKNYEDGKVFYNEDLLTLETEILNRFNSWKNNEPLLINVDSNIVYEFSWQKATDELKKLI
jgi:glycosyltransferase involved in cell wall biosynthesis